MERCCEITMNLSECVVRTPAAVQPNLFETDEFKDNADFHAYLLDTSKKTREETVGKFQSIISLYNFYSELRKKTEDEYATRYGPSALSETKELPLDIQTFYDFLNDVKVATEPPLTLIVEIADRNYDTIRLIGTNLNKILRRERNMVNIDRAQQLDNQCIRWIAKQPGRTAAQKAGPKQQIKAVIRQESFNTLENRVFKHFLQLCAVNAISYIKEYAHEFTQSLYIKKVKRLLNLVLALSDLPEFEGIGNLYSLPKPNFVLQNNPRYRIIWELYLQLVSKQRIIESLWTNRHLFYREFVIHAFLSILHAASSKGRTSHFKQFLWIRKYPDEKGQFFNSAEASYYGFFSSPTKTFACKYKEYDDRVQYAWSHRIKPVGIGVAYIPESLEQLVFPANSLQHVIILEKPVKTINASPLTHIIDLSSLHKDLPHHIFATIQETLYHDCLSI